MTKIYRLFRPVTLLLICLITALSCNDKVPGIQDPNFASLRKGIVPEAFNHEQVGSLVYTHLKYYATTIDYHKYIPELYQEKYEEEFSKLKSKYDTEKWTPEQTITYLVDQGYYTKKQAAKIIDHNNKLLKHLETHPDKITHEKWAKDRENEIAADPELSHKEKSQLLNERVAIHQALRYKLEMMPDEAKANKGGRLLSASCGFWETLACWTGYVTGLSGLSGQASGIAAAFIHSTTSRFITNFTAIGAAIGVIVGTIAAINNCQCDMNSCNVTEGLNFNYACYTMGDPLLFQAWGYGNITPNQFEFQFFKNNDLSNGSNFWGGIAPQADYIYLQGNLIVNNNVQSVAVRSINYCSGIAKTATFGWYVLADLGKPFFSINGVSSLTSSDAANNTYEYTANGVIRVTPNTTITWEIEPSGYPGYSATGQVICGSGSTSTCIRWNSTPGIANVKCTATTACSTIVNYFRVQIQ
jgi:hypothetical protein